VSRRGHQGPLLWGTFAEARITTRMPHRSHRSWHPTVDRISDAAIQANGMTTTNATPPDRDPHGLMAAGAELATEAEIAKILGISRNALSTLLRHELAERVRFVRASPRLYSMDDAKAAIVPMLPALEQERAQRAEREAAQVAAAAQRRAERQLAHVAHIAAKQAKGARRRPTTGAQHATRSGPKPAPPATSAPGKQASTTKPRSSARDVEVIVRRKPNP
jgi:hypothetical protein